VEAVVAAAAVLAVVTVHTVTGKVLELLQGV
jgi:hypothetical protein